MEDALVLGDETDLGNTGPIAAIWLLPSGGIRLTIVTPNLAARRSSQGPLSNSRRRSPIRTPTREPAHRRNPGTRELKQGIKPFNAMQAQIQKFGHTGTMMWRGFPMSLRTPLTRMRFAGAKLSIDQEQAARLFRDANEDAEHASMNLCFFREMRTAGGADQFRSPAVLLTIAMDYADQTSISAMPGPHTPCYRGRPAHPEARLHQFDRENAAIGKTDGLRTELRRERLVRGYQGTSGPPARPPVAL